MDEMKLQGEMFLRGLNGKAIPSADVLYFNWFAIREMAAGRLNVFKSVDHPGWDYIEYFPPADPDNLSDWRIPSVVERSRARLGR